MELVQFEQSAKIAIVGMSTFFPGCDSLDTFERAIYDAQFFALTETESENYLTFDLAERALLDAKIKPTTRLGVVFGTEQLRPRGISDWNFTSNARAFNTATDNISQVLLFAQKILISGDAEAVLVAIAPGALVLKLYETAKRDQNNIYAVIDAISLVKSPVSEETDTVAIAQASQQAFNLAGISPEDVSYLELDSSGITEQDSAEIQGITSAYQTLEPNLSCAIGSVKANIPNSRAVSGIISLIKTSLCLYHRYIPATLNWKNPKNPELWQKSPFYVANTSRPWFLAKDATRRIAAINSIGSDGTYAHIILSEQPNQQTRSNYLQQTPFYFFPIAASDRSSLLEQLAQLQQSIESSSNLAETARQTFTQYQKHSQATYALAILGKNQDELVREIQRGIKGINKSFETGSDWQTPTGSYFTANPLGKKGKVAFVYPGAFNSYVGLGQNLFRLFPKIWNSRVIDVPNIGDVLRQRLLYPRSLSTLTRRQLETLEQQLLDNALAMLETGIGFATFLTEIMKDYFQVKPQCTFGYSLGEISMMCAQNVWYDLGLASAKLNSSPLFATRLTGSKNTVREYFKLPQTQENTSEKIWSNYVLITELPAVLEYLKNETRVYLTHINTPGEVVIAGDPQACEKLISTLNCDYFRSPSDDVLHCEPMSSEYNELVQVNDFPVRKIENNVFYSSASYAPIAMTRDSIAHSIAKGLCKYIDFPQLIHQIYSDGARIFVEAGAGSTCSRWIGENLKNQEHVTIPLNKRGVDDYTSIVRALAKLLSHRVNLNLSPLFFEISEPTNTSSSQNNIMSYGLQPYPAIASHRQPLRKIALKKPHYEKLRNNNSGASKAHSNFLRSRQQSLKQLSEIILVQIACSNKLLEQKQILESKDE